MVSPFGLGVHEAVCCAGTPQCRDELNRWAQATKPLARDGQNVGELLCNRGCRRHLPKSVVHQHAQEQAPYREHGAVYAWPVAMLCDGREHVEGMR